MTKGLHKNSLRKVDNPHQWMIDDARMELIQQIKAEIERQVEYLKTKEIKSWDDSEYGDEDSMWYQGGWKALHRLLSFLDTLQEKSEKPTNLVCEGLEAASEEYFQDVKAAFLRTMEHPTAKECFIAGAAWLAEQGVVEVGTMGDFGVALDKSVVSRMAETFKEGDRVVVQYRLLNK